jgi:Zn-dependent protease with chaperone function
MTRPMMIAAVALAAYCLIDIGVSLLVAMLWRTRGVAPLTLPPATRARRIFLLRLVPAAAAVTVTSLIVLPAFMLYEPMQPGGERSGPLLQALAILAAMQIGIAVASAIRAIVVTGQLQRSLHAAAVSTRAGGAPPMAVVDAPWPMVALVGVFHPVLIATREIVDACDDVEMARIAAHERGHLQSRDNLKRWLMSVLPDTLRWSRIHVEMLDAWHHAAEDAADDAATGDDAEARAELAALLLKVVRLAPRRPWSEAVVSPFVEDDDGLERRVRRLLRPEREAPAPLAVVPVVALSFLGGAAVAVLASPAALETIFDLFEALVAFGR